MVKLLTLLFSLSWISLALAEDKVLKAKCDELKSNLSGTSIDCLDNNFGNPLTSEAKNLTVVSEPLQEWLWVSNRINETMEQNKSKMKLLQATESSFNKAIKGYPGKEKDIAALKEVEEYQSQFEKLFEATKREAMLHKAIQSCYGSTYRFCTEIKRDDLKIQYAKAQADKLSILMSYPLLSNESIREEIEDGIDEYNKIQEKGSKSMGYKNLDDYKVKSRLDRRKNFPSLMLKGITKTKKALAKRQKKWLEMYQESNADAQGEIQFQLGQREKGTIESQMEKFGFGGYSSNVQDLQTDNTEMITELLAGVDVEQEMQNPYIGKAVCSIYNRNQDQIKIDKRNQLILDGALMVAPFFLGPLGLAARLATLGRFANWGVKGRVLIAGSIEGGLIAKDLSDLSTFSKKCDGLKIRMLRGESEAGNFIAEDNPSYQEKKVGFTEMEQCQKDLSNQTLLAIGGATLGPAVAMYGKFGKSAAGKLSEKATEALNNFSKTKEEKVIGNFFKGENLAPEDLTVLNKEFKNFRKEFRAKNPEATSDDVASAFKKEYDQKYGQQSCAI